MNWSNVRLILTREIRDQLRDRRTLFMIAVLPLLLYPLLGTVFFQIAQFMREHPTRVLVYGASELDELDGIPPLFQDQRFHRDLFDLPARSDLLRLDFIGSDPASLTSSDEGDKDVPAKARDLTEEQHLQASRLLVQTGNYQLLIYFPPGFGEQLEQFRAMMLEHRSDANRGSEGQVEHAQVELVSPLIFHNTANEKSQIAHTRVLSVLDRWREQIVEGYLREIRLPALATKPFKFHTQDVAQSGHRDAAHWSKILPFVLVIWALTGAFYPAVDVCAGEKERGTLETLLSCPAERSEIVWGKLLTVMIFSMVTALLNLLSMGLTGAFIIDQMNNLPGISQTSQLNAPPPLTAIWLLVALPPVSALFSSLCIALAAFARSTKEGQYYLMPLVLIIMPLMMLPMAPAVELNLGNSLIPVTGVVLLLRNLLAGNSMQALLYAPPVIAVTLVCCLLSMRWAVDQFNKESVLFRESERLDLRLWMKHLVRDRGPTPSVSEAISCFVLILLIQFFMNLALPQPRLEVFSELALRIFVSLVVMIALPALMMTLLFTKSPSETLLLRKTPPQRSILVALLLAISLHPVVHSLQFVVQKLYPINDAMAAHAEFFVGVLNNAPYPWLPLLLIAVLPALCEEIAFRGFILSGLRHLGHKWWAILLSAVFFGIAHGVLQQSIMASALGVVLGYLAVQSGSLIPCILFHMTHNAVMLLSAKFQLTPELMGRFPLLRLFVRPIEEGQVTFVYGWPTIIVGAMMSAYLLNWFHRLQYRKTAEEKLQEALGRQNLGPLVEEV